MFAIPPFGVLLVAAAFWFVSYLALALRLTPDTLTKLFAFGAISIPLAHVLDQLVMAALERFVKPVEAPRSRSRVSTGIRSAQSDAKASDEGKRDSVYLRDLKI